MYTTHFGLSRKPFNATPDPAFLYTNRCYQEAYATLLYGIQERKGFIALTGEVGTGKTTLLRRLMDGINPALKVVFVYNTTLTFDELVEFICGELGIPVDGVSRVGRLQALNRFLVGEARGGGTVVLLLDEAQNLSHEALENLRLISNLETATDKLLQIVLVGQPELDANLADPTLRQVAQRIAIRFRLEPLEAEEVEPYIDYRLRVVGSSRKALFSDRAIRKLIPQAHGIPRVINVICDNALVLAYATDQSRVSGRMMDAVLADLRLRPRAPRRAAPVAERAVRSRRAPWPQEAAPEDGPRGKWLGLAAAGALVLAGLVVVGAGGSDFGRWLTSLGTSVGALSGPWSEPAAPAPAALAPAAPAVGGQTPTAMPAAVGNTVTATRAPASGPTRAAGTPEPGASPVTEPAPAAVTEPTPDRRRLQAPEGTTRAGRWVSVPRGGTISEIVLAHYGRYSSLALDLIQETNPDIEDLDVVAAGQPLWLPSLTLGSLLRPQVDGSYRLILSSQPTRQAAAHVAQVVRQHGLSAAITRREIAADQRLYRVEISALKSRAAATRAWDTAVRLEWFDLRPEAADRSSLPSRARVS